MSPWMALVCWKWGCGGVEDDRLARAELVAQQPRQARVPAFGHARGKIDRRCFLRVVVDVEVLGGLDLEVELLGTGPCSDRSTGPGPSRRCRRAPGRRSMHTDRKVIGASHQDRPAWVTSELSTNKATAEQRNAAEFSRNSFRRSSWPSSAGGGSEHASGRGVDRPGARRSGRRLRPPARSLPPDSRPRRAAREPRCRRWPY